MNPIKTIVLDLDGPLLDGTLRHWQCYSDILTAGGYEPIDLPRYWDMKRNRIDRRRLLALSDATDFCDEFLDIWLQKIEDREYLSLDRLQPGATDVLSDWKNSDKKLVLATMRNNRANLQWQLDELGIARFLDAVVVVGSSQSGADKAANVGPLLAGTRSDESIWVGDTEVDIDAARTLGIRICALSCGLRTEKYLAHLSPDMLHSDLASLAGFV